VAGLGIGGIAVALAAQNILGDLFASLSIVLDKPFLIGDFIIVDEKPGTVEYIGLKTTRIRSLGGEQLVFSNAEMVKLPIRNYKRMRERIRPRRDLSNAGRKARTHTGDHSGNHRIAGKIALRSGAFQGIWRLRFDFRSRALHTGARVQRVHGRARGYQFRHFPSLRGGRN
jgi:hypothetical protein